MMYQSATLNMSANLENTGVAAGLKKGQPHSNSEEGHERIFKPWDN